MSIHLDIYQFFLYIDIGYAFSEIQVNQLNVLCVVYLVCAHWQYSARTRSIVVYLHIEI